MLVNFIDNKTVSDSARATAVSSPKWMIERGFITQEEAFDFWDGILLNRGNLNVAWVAASNLSQMKLLTQHQKQRLVITVAQIEKWLPWITIRPLSPQQSVDAALDQLKSLLRK